MKTITLAQALEILENASAVIVDDDVVTFPALKDYDEDSEELSDTIFLEVSGNADEEFSTRHNQTARVDEDGRLILINTDEQMTKFMPLVAQPIKS